MDGQPRAECTLSIGPSVHVTTVVGLRSAQAS